MRYVDDEAVACVFNLSADPQVVEDPVLSDAELLPQGAGECEARGGSLGLSPYAAAFLRLRQPG